MSRYGNYPNPQLCAEYGCLYKKLNISIMSGCPGCESQQQFQNIQRATTLKNAIAHAKEHQVPVAIYQDPATREFHYIESAHAAGLPVVQTVSPHFRLPT